MSTGIDQTLTPKLRVSLSYMAVRGVDVLRGANLNAPDLARGRIRPDAAFANVIALSSDAESHTDQLSATVNVNLAPGRQRRPGALEPTANHAADDVLAVVDRQQQRRSVFRVADGGARHRVGSRRERSPSPRAAVINTQALRNLNATLSLAGNTGTPHTITTGVR